MQGYELRKLLRWRNQVQAQGVRPLDVGDLPWSTTGMVDFMKLGTRSKATRSKDGMNTGHLCRFL